MAHDDSAMHSAYNDVTVSAIPNGRAMVRADQVQSRLRTEVEVQRRQHEVDR